jgi:hypothetical protein
MSGAQTTKRQSLHQEKHMHLVPCKKFIHFNAAAGSQVLPDGDGEEVSRALHQVLCQREYPHVRPVSLVCLRLWDTEHKRRRRGEGAAVLRLDEDVTKGRLGSLVTA